MARLFFILILLLLFSTSCGTAEKAVIPFSKILPSIEDNFTIIWVGQGKSFLYQDGQYVRSESNDYTFEVVQRRYNNSWKSIKNMHRIHPEYDGRAGEREQTMFFKIDFSKNGNALLSEVHSSLGNGTGKSDLEFREQQLQFAAEGTSSMAPYNTYRITQHYDYEAGELLETVELIKVKGEEEVPFAKIEEKASIFRPATLDSAPTRFE